ncbi:MAG TPA: hypothetical protein H9867_04490 [Candidatus Corynebacterium gallistercoris]|uniref:Esterase n=1 Tax=Candidatus Corynebacterium gallistercoris TaxID=2838530 RepID=A0A9D1UPX8_9CORY|nr:hypothetical protein [Candidatus Corynebacterium gallistercoris]
MPNILYGLSLISTTVSIAAWTLLVLSLLLIIVAIPRSRRVRATVTILLASVIVAVALFVGLFFFFKTPLEQISFQSIAALGLCVGALIGTIWAIITRWTKIWTCAPLAIAIVSFLLVGNQTYALYPDVYSLSSQEPFHQTSLSDLPHATSIPLIQWQAHPQPAPLDTQGTVVVANTPTPESRFAARDSLVYLPPAWFTNPRPQLPVLVLMPGIPGSPDQWFDEGRAGLVAHNYQKAHGGLSPIIIAVDGTGGPVDNLLCTDSNKAKVRTFLAKDVPAWAVSAFDANPDQSSWTIGGLSYGGTCSLQTILNSPHSYGHFVDISGERTPNDGESHETTVRDYFAGSEKTFQEQNPETLLRTKQFPGITGLFIAGEADESAVRDLQHLNSLTPAAGIESTYVSVPGSHDFIAWRAALGYAFPHVAAWGGLPSP